LVNFSQSWIVLEFVFGGSIGRECIEFTPLILPGLFPEKSEEESEREGEKREEERGRRRRKQTVMALGENKFQGDAGAIA